MNIAHHEFGRLLFSSSFERAQGKMGSTDKKVNKAKKRRSKRGDFLRAITAPLLSILLFGIGIWSFFLPSFKGQLLHERKDMLAQMTQVCWDIMDHLEAEVASHRLSREEAQSRAIRQIEAIRYGRGLKDYFWINDMDGTMIMHPYRKELEGQNIVNMVDQNGKYFMREFLNVVKTAGQGYVDYLWQWQDNPEKIAPKLSHVRGFKPWGWIIGTGMYLEDVSAKAAGMSKKLKFLFLGILILILSVFFFSFRQTLAIEQERNAVELALRESETRFRKLAETAPFGLTISSTDGQFDYINPKFTEIFGYSIEDVPDKETWFRKAYPDPAYRDEVKGTWINDTRELRSKGGSAQRIFRVTCKDGSCKTIRFQNVAIAGKKQSLIYEDITAEEDAREKLLENQKKYKHLYKKAKIEEHLYRSLIESSADAIVIQDLEGKTQYISPTFTQIFGWTEKEVFSKKIPFVPDSEKEETKGIFESLTREGAPCRNFETTHCARFQQPVDGDPGKCVSHAHAA